MPDYTIKQGQYLAFIYNYTKINGVPPAEADMQRFFRKSPLPFIKWRSSWMKKG